jgi:hypothetical protein
MRLETIDKAESGLLELPRVMRCRSFPIGRWRDFLGRQEGGGVRGNGEDRGDREDGLYPFLVLCNLEADISDVEKAFVELVSIGPHSRLLKCLCDPMLLFEPEATLIDLFNYCRVNQECVEWTVAELDRKFNVSLFGDWFMRHQRDFSFLSDSQDSRDSQVTPKLYSSTECPICLEDLVEYVPLSCGHVLCKTCTVRMFDVEEISRWKIRLKNSRNSRNSWMSDKRCPVCRQECPLNAGKVVEVLVSESPSRENNLNRLESENSA